MKKSICRVAFLLMIGAQVFAQVPPAADLKYADKLIQDTKSKSMKRDEICMIVAGVGRAAWTYKEAKQEFPFSKVAAGSPFFSMYLWAFQYGTHQAPNRASAFGDSYSMCMLNAHNTYRAWESGRPLAIAELLCPDAVSSCK
ncbi:MAG: hypothetical protein Q7T13_05910 [Polaromonas sp.]|nr:hypothetical protein [Polaromonas sp.]